MVLGKEGNGKSGKKGTPYIYFTKIESQDKLEHTFSVHHQLSLILSSR